MRVAQKLLKAAEPTPNLSPGPGPSPSPSPNPSPSPSPNPSPNLLAEDARRIEDHARGPRRHLQLQVAGCRLQVAGCVRAASRPLVSTT